MSVTMTEKIYRYDGDLKDFAKALHARETLQIDEEMFYYWLEVLPPAYMNKEQTIDGKLVGCSFGFAEGTDYITDFWRRGEACFCKLSDRMSGGR